MAGFFDWLGRNWLAVLLIAGIIAAGIFVFSKRNELLDKG